MKGSNTPQTNPRSASRLLAESRILHGSDSCPGPGSLPDPSSLSRGRGSCSQDFNYHPWKSRPEIRARATRQDRVAASLLSGSLRRRGAPDAPPVPHYPHKADETGVGDEA